MRIRYADSREERSAVVKLTHMPLVRQMAQTQRALSWDVCRHLLCSLDKAAILSQANQMAANDTIQQETPARFLGGLAKPKRKFDIAALAKRMRYAPSDPALSSAMSLAQPSIALDQQQEAPLPIADIGSSRRWVMIKQGCTPCAPPACWEQRPTL